MALTKSRKRELVEHYKELVGNSNGMVITSYSGVPVKELEGLRRKVRELGGEFHIVKNTLVNMAFDDAGIELPDEIYIGTTAIGFATDDFPGVTKVIVEMARENEDVEIKGGVLEKDFYNALQMKQLADLPPLPVLRAQLLGLMQAPATRVASVLTSSVRQIVNVTKAYADSEIVNAENPA
ncbi:MAG: 50S ribosomal protein L10 [Anaerolineales bacterium]|nr:50S ribosomal protein L10 [Anaerolineales bacterium]